MPNAAATKSRLCANQLAPLFADRGRFHFMPVDIHIIKEGDGKTFPKTGETVVIHYTGTLLSDGSKFDSSVDRGTPFETQIGVGRVIAGWDEAIPKLSVGTKAKLTIPSDLAYGRSGAGSAIPPNADLVFEVELLAVKSDSSDWCSVM